MKIQKVKKKGTVESSKSNYDETLKYIKSAIDSLGKVAKDDVIARESIANLSVVLFDLKG